MCADTRCAWCFKCLREGVLAGGKQSLLTPTCMQSLLGPSSSSSHCWSSSDIRAYCSGVAIMWTSGEERESVTELRRIADRGVVHGVVYAAAAAESETRRKADSM